MASMMVAVLAAGALGGAGVAAVSGGMSSPDQHEQPKVCKTVVGAELGAKPYQMCMTRAEWKAKKVADAKDANRTVCRYQENPSSRLRSYKVCRPASEWESQRLRDRQAVEQIQMRSCVPGAGC